MGFFDLFKSKPTHTTYQTYSKSNQYFTDMEKIEITWSVIQNLKQFKSEQANQLESLCLEQIALYKEMYEFDVNQNHQPIHFCSGYVRLCMLYEKQERYKEAVLLCADAIRSGAYADKSSGQMYGRLARLIKKSGMSFEENIIGLTESR